MQIDQAIKGQVALLRFTFDQTLDREQVEAMARCVDEAMDRHDDLRLLLDLRQTEHYAPDAFASGKGLVSSIRSIGPVSRYAVVGAPVIAGAAVEFFGTFLPLKSRSFAAGALDEAEAWIALPVPV